MMTRLNTLKRVGLLAYFFLPQVLHAQSPRIDLSGGKLRPSLLRVLANPQNFNGQEIQIIGFLCLSFENNALFLHSDDLAFNLFENAIWIDANEEMSKHYQRYNMKYVILRGKFQASDHGHMGLYSGTLTNITRCGVMTDLKHPLWGGPPPPAPHPKKTK